MQDRVQAIANLLDRRCGVDALWLFGSQAQGHAGEHSDLDLAVLFKRRPDGFELVDLKAEAGNLAGREVDLVDLDRASPILAMQILRHGSLLVDRNPSRRVRFVAAAPGRREDVLRVRRPVERRLLERVTDGGA